MIEDIAYGDVQHLPGVRVIDSPRGGPSFPFQGFHIERGHICVSGSLCVPIVANKTSTMAFTDVHPLKTRYLLDTDLVPRGTISGALLFPLSANYYHFLIYRISALALVPEVKAVGGTSIATCGDTPARVTAAVDAIIAQEWTSISPTRMPLNDGVYEVENVVAAQSRNPWFGAFYNRTVTMPWLLRRAGLSGEIDTMSSLKLFVRRNAATRRLINQAEIEDRLLARGFIPIDPGALEFHEQAVLFARATHIVGVEGAAMTNLIFAARAVSVTILANPETATDLFFTDLLERFGVTARIVAGENEPNATLGRNSDFSVSPTKIAEVLAA